MTRTLAEAVRQARDLTIFRVLLIKRTIVRRHGDFLGYAVGKQARKPKESEFRTFEDARAYVRTLGMKSVTEWTSYQLHVFLLPCKELDTT